ncbi:hypothetical protein SDRG_03726 [Saprolegnia diclina VS20]|uniref:Bzip transcription factor n=1 Tax=Saprolegnia diclina (strain VS20) TaxID=1156394 RepID=T0S7P4_SAPDV|nr:hypothetical protein SDRG_03726 [Saprolegnia diclina VS20]EQC38767.1 hypothetical protein SDRG_03726 [Saprolegnia diclina VS20]|eukprot:XP_008607591.1 hypothetical protein SDRG_03726 [Saprolegnia diclina VS20]
MDGTRRVPKTSAVKLAQARALQRRQRAAVCSYVAHLEASVNELRRATARLEGRREAWAIMHPAPERPLDHTASARVGAAYFDICRFGIVTDHDVTALRPLLAADGFDFMGGGGVDELFDQWHRYATYFAAFEMTCHHIAVSPAETSDVVLCTSTMRLRLHRRTLECLFPHLLVREDMVQRLVGRELAVPMTLTLYVRHDGCQIQSMHSDLAFASSLAELLGSLEDTVVAMDGARVHGPWLLADDDDDASVAARSLTYKAP